MRETCVFCMHRPALPHNGGMCGTCAPPLKIRSPRLRRHYATFTVHHIAT